MSGDSLYDTSRPVWNNGGKSDVQSLFKMPPFANPPASQAKTGQTWYDCMTGFNLYLFDIEGQQNNVWENTKDFGGGSGTNDGVYYKLLTKVMPPGDPKFPDEAIEMIRIWYNQGGRVTQDDPFPSPKAPAEKDQIPPPAPGRKFRVPTNPVWNANGDPDEDDIKSCFTEPCWIVGGSASQQGIANYWKKAMGNFQFDAFTEPNPTMFDLQNYGHVKDWAWSIYAHVASGSMPVDSEPFPPEPVEAIGRWYQQGCPETKDQIGKMSSPPKPLPTPPVSKPFVTRQDINKMSAEDLRIYREKLLSLGSQTLEPSVWQVGGFLHSNWCLHYMQASFPWHRAHLLWLEWQIGVAIPYWNFYSSQATVKGSLDYGIPKAFLDETFVDSNNIVQPNPLRQALARNGKSRASTGSTVFKTVQRASPFTDTDTTKLDEYVSKYMPQYHTEIYLATQTTKIGEQYNQGFTFAQPDLVQTNDPNYYKDDISTLDGALEQAHDNIHGWCGSDMANNSFAAFDPLFWSFHANFDRIFENWLRDGSNATQDWVKTPLQPFAFQGAENQMITIEGEKDPSKYVSTTDMTVNSKVLGYSYALPLNPDYVPSQENVTSARVPMVIFPDIKCVSRGYLSSLQLKESKHGLHQSL